MADGPTMRPAGVDCPAPQRNEIESCEVLVNVMSCRLNKKSQDARSSNSGAELMCIMHWANLKLRRSIRREPRLPVGTPAVHRPTDRLEVRCRIDAALQPTVTNDNWIPHGTRAQLLLRYSQSHYSRSVLSGPSVTSCFALSPFPTVLGTSLTFWNIAPRQKKLPFQLRSHALHRAIAIQTVDNITQT